MIYQERGGFRIGESMTFAWGSGWPKALIKIDSDSITIKTVYKRTPYKIDKEKITLISKESYWFIPYLRIEHTDDQVPPFVTFVSWRTSKLIDEISKRNYPLDIMSTTSGLTLS